MEKKHFLFLTYTVKKLKLKKVLQIRVEQLNAFVIIS